MLQEYQNNLISRILKSAVDWPMITDTPAKFNRKTIEISLFNILHWHAEFRIQDTRDKLSKDLTIFFSSVKKLFDWNLLRYFSWFLFSRYQELEPIKFDVKGYQNLRYNASSISNGTQVRGCCLCWHRPFPKKILQTPPLPSDKKF